MIFTGGGGSEPQRLELGGDRFGARFTWKGATGSMDGALALTSATCAAPGDVMPVVDGMGLGK